MNNDYYVDDCYLSIKSCHNVMNPDQYLKLERFSTVQEQSKNKERVTRK